MRICLDRRVPTCGLGWSSISPESRRLQACFLPSHTELDPSRLPESENYAKRASKVMQIAEKQEDVRKWHTRYGYVLIRNARLHEGEQKTIISDRCR